MFKESQPYRNSPAESFGVTGNPMRRITWGAVFAGVVVALVVQMLLSLLGMGIGMGTINPLQESNPFAGLGTGALIWWVISMLISLFIGGWVAGRLAGMPKASDATLHGVLMWSVFTLVSVYLLTTAVGGIISGVGGALGKAVSSAGQSVGPNLQDQIKQKAQQSGINIDEMKQQAQELVQNGDPQTKKEMGDMAEKMFKSGGKLSAADHDKTVDLVMKQTGKSRQEATQQVDKLASTMQKGKAKLDQTEQKARKTGDEVAGAMAKAGIFGFIGLLLGGIVSGLGGMTGRPKNVVVPVAAEAPIYK